MIQHEVKAGFEKTNFSKVRRGRVETELSGKKGPVGAFDFSDLPGNGT